MTHKRLQDFAKENISIINQSLEQLIPKETDKDWIEKHVTDNSDINPKVIERAITNPVWSLLDRGGKRLRPLISLITFKMLKPDNDFPNKFLALPEIIHNGTLMIDDVEDSSPLRRGEPAIHLQYGVDIAINAGNFMYYIPYDIIKYSTIPPETKIRLYELVNDEMIKLSFGQALDIYWHNNPEENISVDEYMKMCALKTGTLFRVSAKLGAILADADDKIVKDLGDFIESIGIAFQIHDDILDLDPQDSQWGKRSGGDITEGKKSLLVIYALNNLDTIKKERLLSILKTGTTDQIEIDEAVELIKSTGAFEYCTKKAEELVEDALEIIKTFPQNENSELLTELAHHFIKRTK